MYYNFNKENWISGQDRMDFLDLKTKIEHFFISALGRPKAGLQKNTSLVLESRNLSGKAKKAFKDTS